MRVLPLEESENFMDKYFRLLVIHFLLMEEKIINKIQKQAVVQLRLFLYFINLVMHAMVHWRIRCIVGTVCIHINRID